MTNVKNVIDRVVLRLALNLPDQPLRLLAGRPVVRDGQTLAAETQLMLRLQKIVREPLVEKLPLNKARRAMARQGWIVGSHLPIGAVRDLQVDGASGPLPARLYTPKARLDDTAAPTLLFLHGGGFTFGGLDSHDGPCRFLAEKSGVKVLAVDYRLALEHPFPAAVHDAFAAFRWLTENTAAVGADPERLAIGGDSAGGNLSAVTAIWAAEAGLPLAFQLLIYPTTDFVTRTRSRELFKHDFYLSDEFIDLATKAYFSEPGQAKDPLASVLLRPSLPDGIAAAFVATAGFDPLRDEGEAYARMLAENGVDVEHKRFPSMIHGFLNVVSVGREAIAANTEIAERLGQALK